MDDKKSDSKWHAQPEVRLVLVIPAVIFLSLVVIVLALLLGVLHISSR